MKLPDQQEPKMSEQHIGWSQNMTLSYFKIDTTQERQEREQTYSQYKHLPWALLGGASHGLLMVTLILVNRKSQNSG